MLFSSDLQDIPYSDWCEQPIHNPLEVVPSKFSGISGCSDGASQEEGSASSTKSTELLLGESWGSVSCSLIKQSSIGFAY